MSQKLVQEQRTLLLKPSEMLKQAHYEGIKKCKDNFKNQDSYCARGILMKKYGEYKGLTLNENCSTSLIFTNGDADDYDLVSLHKFNKHYKDSTFLEREEINDVLKGLVLYNDSDANPNFLELAEFMEREGL